MESVPPLHTARPRRSPLHFLSPLIAGALVVSGALQQDPFTFVMGAGLSVYIWLTRHSRYEVFSDRLVVHYLGLRRRTIPLGDIEDVRAVGFPLGGQGVFVRRKKGGGMVITPVDPEQFVQALDQVRRRFQA